MDGPRVTDLDESLRAWMQGCSGVQKDCQLFWLCTAKRDLDGNLPLDDESIRQRYYGRLDGRDLCDGANMCQ